jgi:FkbH-like protein
MKVSDDQIERLLGETSPQDIKRALAVRGLVPTLSQASRIKQHIQALAYELKTIRIGIVHTYTSELLDPWLHFSAALNQLNLDIYHAPYGVTLQEASENSGLVAHAPDITLLLLTGEDLHPELRVPAACINPSNRPDILQAIRSGFNNLIHRFRESVRGHIIVTLLPTNHPPGLGLYDAMSENSEKQWWSDIKAMLANDLRVNFSAANLIDLDQIVLQVGMSNFFDARLWYSSVFPFAPDGALAVSNAVTSLAAAIHLPRAKVIVVDADNTLWGGVIGEDGINGIALGPEYPGRAYLDFQKKLLCFQQRGFILALCSKNNPEDVNEVFQSHPHQLLRAEHFAAQRINWLPKAENLVSIAQELNLGLDSFIFVDDSDHECSAVRHTLSEVEVVQVPSRPVEIPACLDTLARLEVVSLTPEDLEKTAMYTQERLRKSELEKLTNTGGSVDDYLKSLNMKMTVGIDDASLVARLAQLTQKTNQFNLTTRRYSEDDISGMIGSKMFSVYHFSLADNFGSSGIVGLAIVEQLSATEARLDSFLMSCRVIGRLAEQAFLDTILQNQSAKGVMDFTAEYIPTRKNVLVANFLIESGFHQSSDGKYFCHLQTHSQRLRDDSPICIEGPELI